jgi:heat shock protein HtpX
VAAPLDPARRRKHKLHNLLQSVVLLGGMAGLLALCAWPLVGFGGLLWILTGAALGLVLSPRVSPRLLLAMYRARPLTPANFPEGFAVLRELSRRAELVRVPRFYYIPSSLLNAFSVGQGAAASIAVTDGLLRTLEPREVVGVLAHELSHIRNNDLWIMTLADTISRLTVFMSYAGVFLLVFGLPIMLFQGEPVPWLLIYDADLDAAGLTGDPLGLASALEKLEFYQGRLWERILLPGRRLPDPSLLRSHPPTGERVKRLLELRGPGPGEGLRHGGPLDLPGHLGRVHRSPRMHLPGTWF